MKLPSLPTTFGILALLLISSAVIVLYAQGYRLDFSKKTVEKTGMILARSIPEGAKVYLNGKLITATNSPISELKAGTYHLKIEKEGYFSWEKDVPVEEGLVTEIAALLPPLSPSLTTVTQNGARLITPAPSGNKALFISQKTLYLLNLTNPPLGFLRTSPQIVAEESGTFLLSKATKITWSPNEDQALIAVDQSTYLISVTGRNGRPTLIENVSNLVKEWEEIASRQREQLIEGKELSEELAKEAVKPETIWSPDERRFLYEKRVGDKRQFWVIDLSDPLPVGDNEHRMVWETESKQLRLFWLADSHHFMMIEAGLPAETLSEVEGSGEGTVSLLDLDGSNKHDLFRGTLAEAVALSIADLSKIIILTSFTPGSAPNLYAISLR